MVCTARALYELTIRLSKILLHILCGQFLHNLMIKQTSCHWCNGLSWSNPFLVNIGISIRDAGPGAVLHVAPLLFCPRMYTQQIGRMRCGVCAGRHGPHVIDRHVRMTYAQFAGRGPGDHIFWALLLLIHHKICFHTCLK